MLRLALAGITVAGGLTFSGPALMPAGHAPGAVSGYIVSDVVYDDGGEPGWVYAVELSLDQAASRVDVRLGRASTWATCSPDSTLRWRCAFADPVAVKEIRRLQVVASGS